MTVFDLRVTDAEVACAGRVSRSKVRAANSEHLTGVIPDDEVTGGGGKGRGAKRSWSLSAATHVASSFELCRISGASAKWAFSRTVQFGHFGSRSGGWVDRETGQIETTVSSSSERMPGLPFAPVPGLTEWENKTLFVVPAYSDPDTILARDLPLMLDEISEGAVVVNVSNVFDRLCAAIGLTPAIVLRQAYAADDVEI